MFIYIYIISLHEYETFMIVNMYCTCTQFISTCSYSPFIYCAPPRLTLFFANFVTSNVASSQQSQRLSLRLLASLSQFGIFTCCLPTPRGSDVTAHSGKYYVSQKQNGFNNKIHWYSILVTFMFEFTARLQMD